MGSKYPALKPSEIIRVLKEFGFVFKSQFNVAEIGYIKIRVVQSLP